MTFVAALGIVLWLLISVPVAIALGTALSPQTHQPEDERMIGATGARAR